MLTSGDSAARGNSPRADRVVAAMPTRHFQRSPHARRVLLTAIAVIASTFLVTYPIAASALDASVAPAPMASSVPERVHIARARADDRKLPPLRRRRPVRVRRLRAEARARPSPRAAPREDEDRGRVRARQGRRAPRVRAALRLPRRRARRLRGAVARASKDAHGVRVRVLPRRRVRRRVPLRRRRRAREHVLRATSRVQRRLRGGAVRPRAALHPLPRLERRDAGSRSRASASSRR